MKNYINTTCVCFLLLLLAACNANTDMTTVINDDGSCERILTASVDDKFVQGDTVKQPFPMELKGWDVQWKYESQSALNSWPTKDFKRAATDSANQIIAIAKKHFSSVEQLSDSFKLKPSHAWKTIMIKPVLQKQFRWFYTYYNYQEIFSKMPVEFAVPIEKYLSKEEAGYWFAGQPDIVKGLNGVETKQLLDGIEEKAEEWMMHNLFEWQYSEVMNHLNAFENIPGKDWMTQQKDSIYTRYHTLLSTKKEPDMVKLLQDSFNINISRQIAAADRDSLIKQISEPAAFEILTSYFNASFDYKLMMPGHLIASNGVITNDTLSWKIDAYRLVHDNFTIEASSKKVNWWMFALTGLVVAGAIGLFFIRRK